MSLEQYLQHRWRWEASLWAGFFTFNWAAEMWVIRFDLARSGSDLPLWEPTVWEGSSMVVWLLLLRLLLAFDRRFPLRGVKLWAHVRAHLIFTVPLSVIHVLGMVGIRKLVYAIVGRGYDFGHWPTELFYEYLKDFRSYAFMLGIIYLYRLVIRRLQGEAEFPMQGREESEVVPATDRFLVKKLGREFLVKVDDVDWVEAAGNYVNLHVGERLYPLRETMTSFDARLAGRGFLRVHRSAIVNLDRISEIVPFETGDALIKLASGQQVPVSRRHRKQLRAELAR